MSVGLDTSVVLRLLTGLPETQAESARKLVVDAEAPVAVSDLVVSEVYFALRHHYAVSHPDAMRAMSELLNDARIRCTGAALDVFAADAPAHHKQKPGVMDRLIHADYSRAALTLATFDRELARLPGVRAVTG